MTTLAFQLNEHLYLRDPQHSELGKNIIRKSIEMIDKLGFEQFTFKKLSDEIHSTEASVYRYFENKHRLLHYLTAWYWSWLEYRMELASHSLTDPTDRLKACLRVVAEEKKYDPTFTFVDEAALNRIVIAELDKTYLTKWVDDDNKDGLFLGFKSICRNMAAVIKQINPDYPYGQSLMSTALLAAKQQLFFSKHLPSLSNLSKGKEAHDELYLFLHNLVFGAINKK